MATPLEKAGKMRQNPTKSSASMRVVGFERETDTRPAPRVPPFRGADDGLDVISKKHLIYIGISVGVFAM